ncbi:MAG: twin-arginine translocation signal domain-containing protein [Pyrinomonadaceae bacterium]|nr:twin-arginine translocation signal domain-containing protein [Pyrinomonadaceae bacterium]
MNTSRRQFLKGLGLASAVMMIGRSAALSQLTAGKAGLDMLVIGDSFIWGQGLDERQKIYTLTADWLRSGSDGHRRDVAVKVKAHSGATIKFRKEEALAYQRAGRDETFRYDPEINVGFPSMWKQVEVASGEYRAEGKPDGADLILISGGITDISVAKLLNPSADEKQLPGLIAQYCRDDMFELIEHAALHNPKAIIAVVGYFPIISDKTVGSRLFNSWLETMAFPRPLKPIANNALTRTLYFNKIRRKVIRISDIWITESDKNLKLAIERFNSRSAVPRAVFVPSPITAETCVETPNSLLFRIGKHGRSQDPLYDSRRGVCRESLTELRRSTGLEYPIRYCELAAIGHPNEAGSRAYAESIRTVLKPYFP